MAEILIYDYTETVTDPFWGDIYEQSFVIGEGNLSAAVVNQQINAASGELLVRINSCGGYVFDGWAIYNALVAYAKQPGNSVVVRVEGLAASIASIIAMAGRTITMCQASMLMVHKPTTIVFDIMDSSQLQAEANALNEIEAVLIDIYANKTGLSKQKLQNLIDATTWLSPDNAVALGFADDIEKIERDAPTIPQNVFNKLFSNAGSSTRAYVNSAFKITNSKERNMSTVKELTEKQDKTNSLLEDLGKKFANLFKNKSEGTDLEEDTAEEPATETEESELDKANKRISELEAELAANSDTTANAQNLLNQANAKFDEVTNKLTEIQNIAATIGSDYVPGKRDENQFGNQPQNNGGEQTEVNSDAMKNRKQQYKNKN